MKKPLIILAIIAIAIIGLFVFKPGAERLSGLPSELVPTSSMKTLTGVFVCLPHKDSDGPQTMECAFGMKADDGANYALDWSGMATSGFDLPMGRKYTVTGLHTPIEAISSDHWKIYAVKGIIKVSDYVEVITKAPAPPIDGKVTLELNIPLVVVGSTTLRVSAVTQDSRCPSDVTCIQAGKVAVNLNVNSPKGSYNMELEPGKTVSTETVSVTLDNVLPYPVSTRKTTDGEYRFILTVKSR